MKFKKVISLSMICTMLAGCMGPGVSAENTGDETTRNYSAHIVGEMPATLMKYVFDDNAGEYRTGVRGWYSGTRNSRGLNTDPNFDGKDGWVQAAGSSGPRSIYTLYPITGEKITQEGDDFGYGTIGGDGMASNVYIAYNPNDGTNYFKMDNSKNYVFKVYIKDNHPGEGEHR